MPNIVARIFRRESLPVGVRAELVDMLFTNYIPVIAMGIILTTAAGLIAVICSDVIAAIISVAAAGVSVMRLRLLYAYRKSTSARQATDLEAHGWEQRFERLSISMGALVGIIGFRTLMLPDSYLDMLVLALLFGFAAGLVSRTCMRPHICYRGLFAAVVPFIIGLLGSLPQKSEGHGQIIYITLILLIVAFTLASVESVRHVYRSIVKGLINQRDLSALAGTDALTGLPNRIILKSRFSEGATRLERRGDYMAIHCVDLDFFKGVNDQFGHAAGDALLQAVAQRITGVLQAGDTVARVGGDEFVIIQPTIKDSASAEALARRIIRTLSEPFHIGGYTARIGATIGIAIVPKDGEALDQVMHCADQALYMAKKRGRGSLCIWGEEPVHIALRAA